MSIKITSNISARKYAADYVSTQGSEITASPWVRPSDWLTLPTITDTDQKFVGLHAVFPGEGNFLAIYASCDSGTYTVDWGDGTVDSGIDPATPVYHQFDYTNAALAGTECTRGYKQSIVTVTPDTGNLTDLRIDWRHNQAALNRYTTGWLDIALAGSYLTAIEIGQNYSSTANIRLEQAKIYKFSDSLTSLSLLFYQCWSLKSVPVMYIGPGVTGTDSMFAECHGLEITPTMDLSNVQNLNSMFSGCESLTEATISTPKATTMGGIFSGCYSLRTALLTNVGNLAVSPTYCAGMFYNCYSLVKASLLNLSNVSNFNNTFMYCHSLKTLILDPNTTSLTSVYAMFTNCEGLRRVPLFNTKNVTRMEDMFGWCTSLRDLPLFDTSSVTNMQSMFDNCHSIYRIPKYNTSNVTNMLGMFQSCFSLQELPLFDTSAVTDAYYMFQSCKSLKKIPEFNFSSLTNSYMIFNDCQALVSVRLTVSSALTYAASMFQSCTALQSVTFTGDTSGLTNIGSMFAYCYSLKTAPYFDTSSVTEMGSMFYECRTLVNVPIYDTGSCTSFGSMFRHCFKLKRAPEFVDTSNVTIFGYMFESCYSLEYIPNYNFSQGTNFDSFASTCISLVTAPTMDLTNSTYNLGLFGSCYTLQDASNVTNINTSVSFDTCQLSSSSLDTIYGNLATVPDQTIYVYSNWGSYNGGSDHTIATNKGWTVYG